MNQPPDQHEFFNEQGHNPGQLTAAMDALNHSVASIYLGSENPYKASPRFHDKKTLTTPITEQGYYSWAHHEEHRFVESDERGASALLTGPAMRTIAVLMPMGRGNLHAGHDLYVVSGSKGTIQQLDHYEVTGAWDLPHRMTFSDVKDILKAEMKEAKFGILDYRKADNWIGPDEIAGVRRLEEAVVDKSAEGEYTMAEGLETDAVAIADHITQVIEAIRNAKPRQPRHMKGMLGRMLSSSSH